MKDIKNNPIINSAYHKWMRKGDFQGIEQQLYTSIIDVYKSGINPLPMFEQVAFIPYNTKKYGKVLQVMITYKGYISIFINNGIIDSIYAMPVFENDKFQMLSGTQVDIKHLISPKTKRTAENLVGVYAIATKDGNKIPEYKNKEEIEKLRMLNPFQKEKPSGVWKDFYIEMAKAKILKSYKNKLALSDKVMRAVMVDELVYSEEGKKYIIKENQ